MTDRSTQPVGRAYRWIILGLMSFLTLGTYTSTTQSPPSTLGIVGFLFAIALKKADARRAEGPSIESAYHR